MYDLYQNKRKMYDYRFCKLLYRIYVKYYQTKDENTQDGLNKFINHLYRN